MAPPDGLEHFKCEIVFQLLALIIFVVNIVIIVYFIDTYFGAMY